MSPTFSLSIYPLITCRPTVYGIPAVRPPETYITAAFRGDGSGPWLPSAEAVREAIPFRLRKAFDRSGAKWRRCLPIDMLSLPLHSTRGKLIAELVFRLNP